MNNVYTGIGARKCPEDIQKIMEHVAGRLARGGFILRSGGANGADSAFERGALKEGGRTMIYLPWKDFNGHKSQFFTVSKEAYDIARQNHPAWEECSDNAKLLLSRNVYQMIGMQTESPWPSKFVLCWTEHEEDGYGGTAFAIRIAKLFGIPYLNMFNCEDIPAELTKFIAEQLNGKDKDHLQHIPDQPVAG